MRHNYMHMPPAWQTDVLHLRTCRCVSAMSRDADRREAHVRHYVGAMGECSATARQRSTQSCHAERTGREGERRQSAHFLMC